MTPEAAIIHNVIQAAATNNQRDLDAALLQLRALFPGIFIEYFPAYGLCVGLLPEYTLTEGTRDLVLNQHASIVMRVDEDLNNVAALKNRNEDIITTRLFTPDSRVTVKGPSLWEHIQSDD